MELVVTLLFEALLDFHSELLASMQFLKFLNGISILKELLPNEVKIHLVGFTVLFRKLELRRQRLNHFFYVFLRNGFAKAMADRNNIRH
jgi:hypothetical protein